MNVQQAAQQFARRRVTNPRQSELVRQRLYDFQLYPTAGASQFTFFALPVGQGVTSAVGGTVGSVKTQADTNMDLGGQLPSGKEYLIESIEVHFYPGSVNAANTYTMATLTAFNAVAAATVDGKINDINSFYQSGVGELNILSKNYLRETPMQAFPPKTFFALDSAVASNSATTALYTQSTAHAAGRPYMLKPTISLQPATNFEFVIKYPSAVATPSGFNGRVGVIFDGYMKRASQ